MASIMPVSLSSPRIPVELCREVLTWLLVTPVPNAYAHDRRAGSLPFRHRHTQHATALLEEIVLLGSTSRAFRYIVQEFVSKSIVIRTPGELEYYLHLFSNENGETGTESHGHRANYLDVRIKKPYDTNRLAALLSFTPNLITFLHRPFGGSTTLGRIPKVLLHSLSSFVPRLQNLAIDTAREALTFEDFLCLGPQLPGLEMLHLGCLYSCPDPMDFLARKRSDEWTLPVRTLSLGIIPDPESELPPGFTGTWDIFLLLLTSSRIHLPCLKRVEAPAPPRTAYFFQAYGRQIHYLSTTTSFSVPTLSGTLKACPNIRTLVLEVCEEVPLMPEEHKEIQEIYIVPCREPGCMDGLEDDQHFNQAVLHELLNELYGMKACSLTTVTISAKGPFRAIRTQKAFLNRWNNKWKGKGVRLSTM